MAEQSNNPLSIEQYNSINPTDIKSGGYSIQNLVTRQLDRINFLIILGTSKVAMQNQNYDEIQLNRAVKRGIRCIESYLSSYIKSDEEYQTLTKQIKESLNPRTIQTQNQDVVADKLADWFDLIISRLDNIDLLPQKRMEIEFD